MSTNRWSNPVNSNLLRDKLDNVLVSGSIAIYEAGTSTPVAVFSDPEQTTSLGSTLNADAYGLIPDFHIASGTQVKIVAYDAQDGAGGAGAIKWTRDYIFGADSALDTRVDGIESTISAISVSRNGFLNSSCQQRNRDSNENLSAAPTISASFQEGQVIGHYALASSSSAGTIGRGTTTDIEAGYYLSLDGVTTTDSGSVSTAQFRVRAGDTGRFVNGNGTFTCYVYHDTGSAKDFTVTLKKADAENDFSSTTTIQAASAVSVASGIWTKLTYSYSAFGDCRNGIAAEVSCACGVQTTKNYRFTMPHLDAGLVATAWIQSPTDNDKAGLLYKPRKYYTEFHSSSLRLASAADAAHDITLPAGGCRDSSDAFDIDNLAALTKQIDADWIAGNNAGGFPFYLTITANTWYRFFVIAATDGTTDAGFDTSATAANLMAEATDFTYYRHIGSVYWDGSAISSVITNGLSHVVERLSSGSTWTVPPNVYCVDATLTGAGGGGTGGTGNGSSGASTTFDGSSASGGAGGGPASFIATPGAASNNGGMGNGDPGGVDDNIINGRGGQIRASLHEVTPLAVLSMSVGAGGSAGSGGGGTPGGAGEIVLRYSVSA